MNGNCPASREHVTASRIRLVLIVLLLLTVSLAYLAPRLVDLDRVVMVDERD
jgi:hypothetical protein